MTRRITQLDVAIRARQLNEVLASYGANVEIEHEPGNGYRLSLWEGERYIMDLSPAVTQAVVCHILWAMRGTLEALHDHTG